MLSYDEATDENVVSRQLVIEILNKPIHPIKKEMRSAFRTAKDVDGYTELVWCMAQSSKRIYTGLFYVSSDYSPRYDVVLGRGSNQTDGYLVNTQDGALTHHRNPIAQLNKEG